MTTLPIISRVSQSLATHPGKKGYKTRDYKKQPLGSLGFCKPFDIPLIPKSEWADRIEVQEKTQSSLVHLCDAMGVQVKDQGQTNYCWINAPVHCLEIIRAVQNQPHIKLSPASVGAKIKNFRNVGGWGTEGLDYLVKHGAVPSELWPSNAINKKYDTSKANAERKKYKVLEWTELDPRNFNQLATMLLLNVPVAIGLNWWGHEVTAVRLVYKGNGKFNVVIDNSWGVNWGVRGRSELTQSKATPDDAVCPRSVTASLTT